MPVTCQARQALLGSQHRINNQLAVIAGTLDLVGGMEGLSANVRELIRVALQATLALSAELESIAQTEGPGCGVLAGSLDAGDQAGASPDASHLAP